MSARTTTAGSLVDPVAYSYVRFSDPVQLRGDSLRRQTEAAAAWCAKNGVRLDTSLTLRDLGVSAFRGKHHLDDKHCLGQFLRAVNQGKVAARSYLLIENLDRLSREEEVPACHLLTSILMAGVQVVQLSPYEMLLTDKSNGWELMRAVMELSRGHRESAVKSKRNGEKWEEKRKAGQKQPPRKKDVRVTASLTNHLPAWVEDEDGVLRLIPEKAAAVRRVYVLSAAGLGAGLIVKTLIREGHPALGPSGLWSRAYVSLLLKDGRAKGEFQPRYRNGQPAGDPIPKYYPPCVTEAEREAGRIGTAGRKQPRGRVGEHVNVFAGLLKNAREGDTYYMGGRTNNGKYRRVLIAARAMENGSKVYGFDFDTFERAVLGRLREVNPKEILGDAPGQDELIVLSNELAHVQAEQADILATLMSGQVKALVPVLEKKQAALDAREKELREKLDEVRRQAAYPAGECWGEAMTLIDVLDNAPDPKDARLKLRALLARLVESVWLLVVPLSETWRVCAVQVFFASGARRDYLILSQSAGHRRKGGWECLSFAKLGAPDDLDLRRREDVTKLEEFLSALELPRTRPGSNN